MFSFKSVITIAWASIPCMLVAAAVPTPARSGYPLETEVAPSQGFNVPWSENKAQQHTGIDLPAAKGKPIFAVKSGTVYKKGSLGVSSSGVGWGYYIVVLNDDGTVYGYLHMTEYKSPLPSYVKKGQVIGLVFNNHLHFNECYQVAGCQHGAWENPTYNKSMGSLTKYYKQPRL